jgi:hypothetical protein
MHRIIVHAIGVVILGLAATRTTGQTANTAAHAAMIEDLKKAHRLLDEADHDYDGHRVKAAEEVHKALKELGHNPKPATAKAKAKAKSGKGNRSKEDQTVSDGQLREAQKLLAQSLSLLQKRHPKAHINIQAAIGQINLALSIR